MLQDIMVELFDQANPAKSRKSQGRTHDVTGRLAVTSCSSMPRSSRTRPGQPRRFPLSLRKKDIVRMRRAEAPK